MTADENASSQAAAPPNEGGSEARPRWQRDLFIIGVTLVGVYAFIAVLGLIAGLPSSGIIRTIRSVTMLSAAYALVVLALNLHWGYTGLFNIGVAGFMAVGAYTMAITTSEVNPGPIGTPGLGLPVPVGIVLGMIAAAIVGFVVVLPAIRIRADYFAIVTLAFAESTRLLITSGSLREFSIAGHDLGTGGGSGLSFPQIEILIPNWILYRGGDVEQGANFFGYQLLSLTNSLGIERGRVEDWLYVIALLLLVGAVFWLLVRTGNSPFGRLLKAIREDELAAKSLGKNTNLAKIKVFMLGCAIMGLAGIMWQGRNGYTDPNAFLPITTFYIFIALIIGGSGSNTGSVVGSLLFVGLLYEGTPYFRRIINEFFDLPEPNTAYDAVVGLDPTAMAGYFLGELANVRFILFGIILILLMIYRPDGILGDRNEPASPIDLRQQQPPSTQSSPVAGDGGESDD